jgi:hypothetical protein
MILIERYVDIENTTYRVVFGRAGPFEELRP